MTRKARTWQRSALALLLAAAAAPATWAHMPYVLPSLFDAGVRDGITIAASFAEDAFRPEIAMQDAPFEVTAPDGTTARLGAPTLTRDITLVAVPLAADGLYRISSGQRVGRMGRCIAKALRGRLQAKARRPPARCWSMSAA